MRPSSLAVFLVFFSFSLSTLRAGISGSFALPQQSSHAAGAPHAVSHPADLRNDQRAQDSTPVVDSNQPQSEERIPIGFLFAFHFGLKTPFNQAPLFGNNFGIIAGYRLFPLVILTGYLGRSVLMNYSPAGSDIYMEATTRTVALETRFTPLKNFYLTAGLGHLHIRADTLRHMGTAGQPLLPGFSQSMLNISAGAGVAFQGFFFEVRPNFGVDRLQVTPERSSEVRNFEIRLGVNLEM